MEGATCGRGRRVIETTEDRVFGGRVRLRQPANGYRVNVDTVLLAAAVTPGARLLEAGCGVGGALLCAAARFPEAQFVGVERDPEMAALARENVAANGARAEIVSGDIRDAGVLSGVFDGAFLNPPYDDPGRISPLAPARRGAHAADAPLADWIGAIADHLSGGAALTLIHRAEAVPEILAALAGRVGSPSVIAIRPRAEAPAKRVLVRAVKGGRAPLAILPDLVLHDESGGKYAPRAEAVLRGEAPIQWTAV